MSARCPRRQHGWLRWRNSAPMTEHAEAIKALLPSGVPVIVVHRGISIHGSLLLLDEDRIMHVQTLHALRNMTGASGPIWIKALSSEWVELEMPEGS